jgi:iron uptake system component EfeO
VRVREEDVVTPAGRPVGWNRHVLPRLRHAAVPVGVVALTGLLVGLSALQAPARQTAVPMPMTTAITVSRNACGQDWADPAPGARTFLVRNSGSSPTEVDLIDPASGASYGEIEGLGPNVTEPLRVVLGNGSYAFRCASEGADPVTGPTMRVTGGAAHGSPAVVPVTKSDLLEPLKQYQAYVQAGLDGLVTDVDTLRDRVHAGNLSGARAAWLTAHLAYERLGAAYDAFGDFDQKIDGLPDGLPGRVTDPDFTGFHRVEYGLWHGESASSLASTVDELAGDVQALRDAFPTQEIDPLDLGLRAHEILENTLQFELTGDADQGSGTTLATASANLDGTRELLTVLRPLLVPRYPGLSEVDAGMAKLRGLVESAHNPDGSWTGVAGLSQVQRAKLDGATGDLLERLAPVAVICEPRRTS